MTKIKDKIKEVFTQKDSYSAEDLINFANYLKNEAVTNKYTPITESDIKAWQEWGEKETARLEKAEEDRKLRLEAVKTGEPNGLVR